MDFQERVNAKSEKFPEGHGKIDWKSRGVVDLNRNTQRGGKFIFWKSPLPALQSERRAINETSTLDMVNAGDHLSFRTSKQITP